MELKNCPLFYLLVVDELLHLYDIDKRTPNFLYKQSMNNYFPLYIVKSLQVKNLKKIYITFLVLCFVA